MYPETISWWIMPYLEWSEASLAFSRSRASRTPRSLKGRLSPEELTEKVLIAGKKRMSPIARLKPYEGPVILSYGFRPFFLLGACQAALSIALWLPLFEGEIGIPTLFLPRDWHAHEMLFGYIPAVLTGFLLTAIPNW